jgi:hypothetical protein
MRLTLRILMDYLDDRLEPELTRQIGDHLAEHDKLRQLTDRIKRVVRRRRLNTPDEAERDEMPVHHEDDPNQVAAYLDGRLGAELEADFEEVCMDTDVYLAEVAACHQIMSLGDQEIRVPPFARQRMYGLVDGPEAQPLKVVPRESRSSRTPLWEVDGKPGYEDETQAPLEPLFHDVFHSGWRRLVPAIAVGLLAAFVGLILWNMPHEQPGPEFARNPAPVAKPAMLKGEAALLWPAPIIQFEGQPAWRVGPQAVADAAALVAARPTLPVNMLLAMGSETAPALAANATPKRSENEPVVPLPPLEKAANVMPPPQRGVRVAVGANAAEALGMFVHGDGQIPGKFVRPQEPIQSNELLVALPGYTGSVNLQSQLKLTLVGQFTPTLAASPYAEAVVELHPTQDADLDVTLHRGRMIVVGRPMATAKVRFRYRGEGWDLTLQPNTEVGFQATGNVLPGEGDWQVRYQLETIVNQGKVDASRNGQTVTLASKGQLSWNSQLEATKPGDLTELGEVPVWLSKRQTASKEFVESLVALRSRTHAKLQGNDGKDLTWFRLACEEGLEERRLPERQAALIGLSAVDHILPVVQLMNEPAGNGKRKYAHDVVHHWLNQGEDRATILVNLLVESGYTQDNAKLLLALFRSVSQSSPAVVTSLLANMNHPQLAIREQAYRDLSTLEPDRPSVYDPASTEEQRLKAIEVIRNRLTQKKNGVVPPPP